MVPAEIPEVCTLREHPSDCRIWVPKRFEWLLLQGEHDTKSVRCLLACGEKNVLLTFFCTQSQRCVIKVEPVRLGCGIAFV